MAELATALQIDPNHADARTFQGEVQVYAGKADEGLDHIGRAFRLNPHPPGRYYWYLGLVEFCSCRVATTQTLGQTNRER